MSWSVLKMKKGHEVNSPSYGLQTTYLLPISRIHIWSSLKHPWRFCSKSLGLYLTSWGLKQNGWYFDSIFKCSFFSNQCINIVVPVDIVQTTILVQSHPSQFTATCSLNQKYHCFDQILSFRTLAVQPVTKMSWNDKDVANFVIGVPIYRIWVRDAQTGCIDSLNNDMPSWDIMPESWSGDNWIKTIVANAD